jgi:CheY-like chemotaxis protein
VLRTCSPYLIVVGFLAVFALPLAGQEKKEPIRKAEDEYRQFFKKPETAIEFWAAMNFEIEVGKFALAAEDLKGFMAKMNDEVLLQIEKEQGMSAFLRLLNVPELRKDAKTLLERVTEVVKKNLGDPVRLRRLVKNLLATPEERSYAIGELHRAGALAVPYLIEALQHATNTTEHASILTAMLSLGPEIVPPLLAALDVDDPVLRIELIDLLERRGDKEAVPYLWYLSASPKQPDGVRRKALEALVFFLDEFGGKRAPGQPLVTQGAIDRLPPAKLALVREAERYYLHQVRMLSTQPIDVWQWKNGTLVAQPSTASQAEEYFGLRFAGQALDLDSGFEPAQVIFLSIALDKGGPNAKQLAREVNPDLVIKVLERAMAERRLPVILGTIHALGDLGEMRAARAIGGNDPALVKALFYPDRRVQFAAADALLRMPSTGPQRHPARIVEILRRPIFTGAVPRVLVGDGDKMRANDTAKAIQEAGFETVVKNTGREVMTRLAETPDIDVVVIDADTPDPGFPYLLAQLRADVDVAALPVIVTSATPVPKDPKDVKPGSPPVRLNMMVQRYPHVWVYATPLDKNGWKGILTTAMAETIGQPVSEEERKADAGTAILWLKRLAVGEVPGYDVRPAAGAIFKALQMPELATLAIEAAGRLPGPAPQRELTRLVLGNGPPPIRAAAAQELARHIEVHGNALAKQQVKAITDLFEATDDAKLKGNLALVLGSLRPDPQLTGVRLQRYTTTTPAAPAKEK